MRVVEATRLVPTAAMAGTPAMAGTRDAHMEATVPTVALTTALRRMALMADAAGILPRTAQAVATTEVGAVGTMVAEGRTEAAVVRMVEADTAKLNWSTVSNAAPFGAAFFCLADASESPRYFSTRRKSPVLASTSTLSLASSRVVP
jgi:hypothetical protein